MFYLGIAVLAVAAAIVIYKPPMPEEPKPELRRWCEAALRYFAAVILGGFGVYMTNLPPYFALIGLFMVVYSFSKFGNNETLSRAWAIGIMLCVSAGVTMVGGLFASPTSDQVIIEDRENWSPIPMPDRSEDPAEILAVDWSSNDRHADWPVADLMLDLCRIAYQSPVDAEDQLDEIGLEHQFIESGAMSGYVLKLNDTAVIILRGTESNAYDVVQDLRFLKATNDNGSMHGGFATGYQQMHGQVKKLLAKYDAKRVWITGHSLGGALAVVCAHELLEDGDYSIAGVMTFGQPKVVRSDMRAHIEPLLGDRYVFFVNDMDPVTRVISPYVHFGHMVRYVDGEIERTGDRKPRLFGNAVGVTASEETYTEAMSDAELDALLDRLEKSHESPDMIDGRPVVKGFFPNVMDHKLNSYAAMLQALIEGE